MKKKQFIAIVLFFCMIFSMFPQLEYPQIAEAATVNYIYLSGTEGGGSDDNDGLTAGTPVATFTKAKSLLTSHAKYHIMICGKVTVNSDETWSFGTSGRLTSTSKITWAPIIYRGVADDNLIEVTNNATLNLQNITIDGNSSAYGGLAMISVKSGSTLNINAGAVLKNNKTTGNGGAINNTGTITVNGGSIKSNSVLSSTDAASTTGFGGGIYNEGVLNIISGSISLNTAVNGGGIYLNNKSSLNMYGGSISENTTTKNGGGIYTVNSYFNLFNGDITKNNCTSGGAGVYSNTSSFNMYGGNISYNISTTVGGGIYLRNKFSMYDGKITGNTATTNGGGLYLADFNANANLYGGSIDNNIAKQLGGGIYDNQGQVKLDGGKIESNQAKSGGGIYQWNNSYAIITLIDGIIANNFASDAKSGDIYSTGNLLNICDGGCYVGNSIVSKYPINISGPIIKATQVYKLIPEASIAGTVVVKPSAGVFIKDASPYLQNFEYGGYEQNITIDKSGTSLVLKYVQFIDGQNGDDANNGYTPLLAKKTIPAELAEDTVYYIVGTINVTEDTSIAGNMTSRIVRYTGFKVQGVSYSALNGDMFEIEDGATLTLSNVEIAGKRSALEEYNADGAIICNGGVLSLKGATSLIDNNFGAIYLETGKVIEASEFTTNDAQITVNVEDACVNRVIATGITSLLAFQNISDTDEYITKSDGTNLVLGTSMNAVYVDPQIAVSGDGLSSENAFKTIDEAIAYFGDSEGVAYIVNTMNFTANTAIDGRGILTLAKYENLAAPMITVSSGKLTLCNIILDGSKSNNNDSSPLINIKSSGTASIEGNSALQNNTGYLIEQGGTLSLKGRIIFSGTILLKSTRYITDNGYAGSITNPLKIDLEEASPKNGRYIIVGTDMFPLCFDVSPGYNLINNSRNISISIIPETNTVYLNGQSGNDTRDGQSSANSVKTYTKAYELLKETGGVIYVTGGTDLSNTFSITEATVIQNGISRFINSGASGKLQNVYIKRADGYTGALFNVKAGGKLDIGKIIIDGNKNITASEPIIIVSANGQLKTEATLIVNANYASYGGAIENYGKYSMKNTTIKANDNTALTPIYQANAMNVSGNNFIIGQEIYLKNGCFITVDDILNQVVPMTVRPETINDSIKLATAYYGTASGDAIIQNFALPSDIAAMSYGLLAFDKDVKLCFDKHNVFLALSTYEKDYTGNPINYEGIVRKMPGTVPSGIYTLYYKLSTEDDDKYTAQAPTNAESYNVKAIISGNALYSDTESNIASFTINKIIPTVNVAVSVNDIYKGQKLGEVVISGSYTGLAGSEITGCFNWDEGSDIVLTEAGSHAYTFTPDDINYETVHGSINVAIKDKPLISIISQPLDMEMITDCITGSLSITANVSNGSIPTYQWYKCDDEEKTGAAPIDDAIDSSYTIPLDLTAGEYYYFCRIASPEAEDIDSEVAKVTVSEALPVKVNSIVVTSSAISINIDGGTLQLGADILPVNAANKSITWSVNDPLIASINQNGMLTAISNGLVTVKATAQDGSEITGSIDISISGQVIPPIPVSCIAVTGSAISITSKGGTLQLYADISPVNATNKDVVWTVDNTSIASISQSGLLTAKEVGTVTVQATAQDVSQITGSIQITISGQTMPPQPSPTPVPQPNPEASSNTSGSEEKHIFAVIDGKNEYIGTVSEEITDGIRTTVIIVDEQKLHQKTEGKADIDVILPIPEDNPATLARFTGQTIKDMENKSITIVVNTSNGDYVVPAKEINISQVSNIIGPNTQLRDIEVTISITRSTGEAVREIKNSSNKENFQIVLPPVDFEINARFEDETVKVDRFNSFIARLIEIPEGIDTDTITTGVVKNDDGSVRHVPTELVVIDGKYYAKINSLTNTTYAVICNHKEFADMEEHWAKAQVNEMYSRRIINGVAEDTFEPDRGITRAEFAAIIVKALGLKVDGLKVFQDVKESDWFYGYVATASEYNIINGVGNGTFEPLRLITREEAMSIIHRAAKISGMNTAVDNSETLGIFEKFDDSCEFAAWAKQAAVFNIEEGLMQGYNGMARPKENITRAETAVIVMRMLQKAKLIDERVKA